MQAIVAAFDTQLLVSCAGRGLMSDLGLYEHVKLALGRGSAKGDISLSQLPVSCMVGLSQDPLFLAICEVVCWCYC